MEWYWMGLDGHELLGILYVAIFIILWISGGFSNRRKKTID
jgi:hypothetical protein